MSTSTLILDPGTNGGAQVTPDRFPAQIQLSFSPQAQAEAYYGLDGQKPTIPLTPGQTINVTINVNSLQLQYRVVSGQAKLQWEL
ncbi:hypothetical protein C8N46_10593 [Kordia periserrulae]|uniref:Uncharacterized protein n=1 Tax=Kordia periserrulae TaxID=701523 RepID=A0A2T6BY93_9FLAO|nr:hypothetical protein [Kordia periserrulae]PTX60937.1 hypothetical protein C8N46_10593 [Kordia periserrulae]